MPGRIPVFALMRTMLAGFLSLVVPSLMMGALLFCSCSAEKQGAMDIRRDHEAISQLLDSAVLSDSPAREFLKALSAVRGYASVDSAWIDGVSFFVRYKNGGIVTWTAPPQPPIQGQH
jgi:hypothetical protein